MTRTDLIAYVAETTDSSKAEVAKIVNAYEEKIMASVADGEKVQLSGFMSFASREVAARERVIPSTKEVKMCPSHKAVSVKAMKKFKNMVH